MRSLERLVSGERRRFVNSKYDLDLTYITDRIIAMGLPAYGFKTLYRNTIGTVAEFFEEFHPNHYMIFKLNMNSHYDAKVFKNNNVCTEFRCMDHNVFNVKSILQFCKRADEFLNLDPKNVIAIHCKAGKGRTGLMVCCFLIYSGVCESATHAQNFYSERRMLKGIGLTITSQIRYLDYFQNVLNKKVDLNIDKSIRPLEFCVEGIKKLKFKSWGLVNVYIESLDVSSGKIMNRLNFKASEDYGGLSVKYHLNSDLVLAEDFKVTIALAGTIIFSFWLNTKFLFLVEEKLL